MIDRKRAAVLLATAALLLGGAALPGGVAALQDAAGVGKVGYAQVGTVELDLTEDGNRDVAQTEHFDAKLALYGKMYTVPMDFGVATHTREEIMALAMDELAAYVDAGLVEWCDFGYEMLELYIGIDPTDPSNNNLFWAINLVQEGEPNSSLFLHVDDETGKILYLTYDSDLIHFDEEGRQQVAERVPELYFTALGMEDVYRHWVDNGLVEYYSLGEGTLVSSYTVGTAEYGELVFEFVVLERGFEIVFDLYETVNGQ